MFAFDDWPHCFALMPLYGFAAHLSICAIFELQERSFQGVFLPGGN
jgi:hypothetical protein